MTLNEIIQIADKAYGEGLVSEYWDFEKVTPKDNEFAGDTLALFIVRELYETYDEDTHTKSQLKEAAWCLTSAAAQLDEVCSGLLLVLAEKRETDA